MINEEILYDIKETTVSDTKLLAIQYYRVREMFMFDILNQNYDPIKGHLSEQNELPIVVIYLSDRKVASRPYPSECARINKTIRHLYNANSLGSIPPFIKNHTTGIPLNYLNPRNLRRSEGPNKGA